MGRIRTIKPEFPHSESMGKVSREARLLFILLWTLADDAGRLRGTSRMLASLLYPYDSDAAKHIDKWIADLEREGCIVRYVVDDSSYVQVCNWLSHQKIDHPSPSKIPAPREPSRALAKTSVGLDLEGIGSGEEGIKETPRKRVVLVSVEKPSEISEEAWMAWLAVRKTKKATAMSQIVLDGLEREAKKAGWTLEAAVRECVERNWIGFKAEWAKREAPSFQRPATGFSLATSHIQNTPLGSPMCQCEECVKFRNKRGLRAIGGE